MTLIKDNLDFREAISKRKHFFLGNIGDPKFSMYNMLKLVPDHRKADIQFDEDRERFLLHSVHKRGKLPALVKEVINDLKHVFYKNLITLDIYSTFYEDRGRAAIHKDIVDVIYLQSVGEVDWSVWESDKPEGHVIDPDEATLLFDRRLTPGDMIYMPSMVAHRSMPVGHARLGLSFAADGAPVDTSTYIS